MQVQHCQMRPPEVAYIKMLLPTVCGKTFRKLITRLTATICLRSHGLFTVRIVGNVFGCAHYLSLMSVVGVDWKNQAHRSNGSSMRDTERCTHTHTFVNNIYRFLDDWSSTYSRAGRSATFLDLGTLSNGFVGTCCPNRADSLPLESPSFHFQIKRPTPILISSGFRKCQFQFRLGSGIRIVPSLM